MPLSSGVGDLRQCSLPLEGHKCDVFFLFIYFFCYQCLSLLLTRHTGRRPGRSRRVRRESRS